MEKISPEIEFLLSREGLFSRWLTVERALANAQAALGIIPETAAEEIAKYARVGYLDMDKYDEIYEKTGHPMVSMLKLLENAIDGPAAQYIHLGATTQDIIDTAMVLAIRETMDQTRRKLVSLVRSAAGLAKKYAHTPMMGRTHNIQALPITFGYKAAIWAGELYRCIERLDEGHNRILVLQMSGAVGSMVAFDGYGDAILEHMAGELGLNVPDICWHASRDRYGEFVNQMALIGGALGRIAQEIYSLMGTEYGELSEYWGDGRVGSSTMPHKVNPTSTQHIMSKAMELRYNAAQMMEYMLVDHERNMQHFIGERKIMEETCLCVSQILDLGDELLATLVVNEDNMWRNLNRLGGLTQSENVMLAYGKKAGKQNAHSKIGKIAVHAFMEHQNFEEVLKKDEDIVQALGKETIHELLNPLKYMGRCPEIAENMADGLLNKLHTSRK